MTTSTAMLKPTERLKNHSVMVTDMGNGNYQILIYSMSNMPVAGHEGELFTIDYEAIENVGYKTTTLNVENIVVSDAKGVNKIQLTEQSVVATIFTSGDVNNDGKANITDAIGIVNHILLKTPSMFIEMVADMNEDGVINITDAIGVINKILQVGNNAKQHCLHEILVLEAQ